MRLVVPLLASLLIGCDPELQQFSNAEVVVVDGKGYTFREQSYQSFSDLVSVLQSIGNPPLNLNLLPCYSQERYDALKVHLHSQGFNPIIFMPLQDETTCERGD